MLQRREKHEVAIREYEARVREISDGLEETVWDSDPVPVPISHRNLTPDLIPDRSL